MTLPKRTNEIIEEQLRFRIASDDEFQNKTKEDVHNAPDVGHSSMTMPLTSDITDSNVTTSHKSFNSNERQMNLLDLINEDFNNRNHTHIITSWN